LFHGTVAGRSNESADSKIDDKISPSQTHSKFIMLLSMFILH